VTKQIGDVDMMPLWY